MTFDRALRSSAILLTATGFVGLLLTRSIPVWLMGMTLASLTYAVWHLTVWPGRRPGAAFPAATVVWNALLIGAFALFLVDLTVISRDLLPAGIHFLVILLNIKLITLQDRRDFRHVYAISLMAVLASAALTTDLWYLSIFSLYVLAAVWSLLLYHLTDRPAASFPVSTSANPTVHAAYPRITSRFFWLTNAVAVSTFALTLLIFFLLPRVSVGILQKPRGEGLRTTGFSERVDLGMIGSIKEDPQIVMRVELPDQPSGSGERFYLRGLAFDQYNGRSWNSGGRQRRSLGVGANGAFVVRPEGNRRQASLSEPLRQDILLEALDTSVLFAAPFAESLSGEFAGMQLDSTSGLHLPYPSTSRMRYSVMSRDHRILPSEQHSADLDYAPMIRDRYLQLPQHSDRIAELTRMVTRDSVTPSEKATAVLRHLLSNYGYSLEADTAISNHPIDDFLFTRKTGYCEHYATAMVLMLRSIGIPSRLVTGFLATEWNEFGNYYTVRQRDAHAWVEVYYPQSGWITMDPTPSNPVPLTPSAFVAFQRFAESVRLHWDRAFIRYSGRDQMAIIHSLRDGSDSARGMLGQWAFSVGAESAQLMRTWMERVQSLHWSLVSTLIVGAILSITSLVFLILHRRPYSRLAEQPPARAQQQIVQLYKKMLELSVRRGIRITPSTTPTEICRLVSKRWAVAETTVVRLSTLYCRARFGDDPLSHKELLQAVDDLGVLKRLVRTSQ
jgi:transglutaminase-like putative cysteine protease